MPKLASLATLNDWYENGMQEVREFDSPRLHQKLQVRVVRRALTGCSGARLAAKLAA